MKKFFLLRSQRTIVISSSLVLLIAVFVAVQIGFQKSEQMLIEKTSGMIAKSLSRNEMSVSSMLDTARKLSAASGTNKTIANLLAQAEDSIDTGEKRKNTSTYSLQDIERIHQIEGLLTYYRNTFFDYQVHALILGSDGCLYSVLDGVDNSSLFGSNFASSIIKQEWYQDFLKSDEISTWVAPCSYSKTGTFYTQKNKPEKADQYVLFIRRIRDYATQKELGISVVSLCTENFSKLMKADNNAGLALLNTSGAVIYASDDRLQTLPSELWNQISDARLDDSAMETTGKIRIKNEDYLINYATIPSTGWNLVNLMPYKATVAEIKDLQQYIYTISFLIVLGATILCAAMLIYITMPMNRLFQRMGEMQIGNHQVGEKGNLRISNVNEAEARLYQMLDRIEKLSQAALEQQKLEQNLQFETLRAQLNPHFLFNTLNTIKWSAMVSGAGNIAEMIAALGRLLESSMRRGEETVMLKSELELVRAYMQIKNWTLKYRIILNIEVEEELYHYMVFKYCLQPLVENAVIHGVDGSENGVVTIRGWREEASVWLEVHDNGRGISADKIANILNGTQEGKNVNHISGVGLSSVNGMIQLRYGAPYGIDIQSEPLCGTTVTMHLPYTQETNTTNESEGEEDV